MRLESLRIRVVGDHNVYLGRSGVDEALSLGVRIVEANSELPEQS